MREVIDLIDIEIAQLDRIIEVMPDAEEQEQAPDVLHDCFALL